MDYESVIGLETHCELLTESKLWCPCSTRFGQPPNSQTCPVCLGLPGALPVLNVRAFELALQAALALGCTVNRTTFFDRKNYYYPDLPKNYQISQNTCNLGIDGALTIRVDGQPLRVGITNVHLEEDAGKNLHAGVPGADYSLVDLNRACMPLLEVVSAPDMRTVQQADAYMQALRRTLLHNRVSDCKMQEGSLRFEASISMRPAGAQTLGARVEIKNLNSMKAVRSALEYEIARQSRRLAAGEPVAQETRLWDETAGRTARMRTKEEAHDYRYFPDPDLLPVQITDEMLERVRTRLAEAPVERRERFQRDHGLSAYDADVLTDLREVADYFEQCLETHNAPKSLANWIMNLVLAQLNERRIGIEEFELGPERLAGLVRLLDAGTINAAVARDLMARMIETGRDAAALVAEDGLEQVNDESALEPVVRQVVAENPDVVRDYHAGRKQAVGPLVGQVMRLTGGKADPRLANTMLRAVLDSMKP
ncbi:MAG: Asp-tRNA(Asn)/Glu-tRNA(Gln) amidotransferase subunit GatB [Candidatus Brocadiaceae bacterium]|nr:Asp-tRNA(Asn)/Glu-tRNA(Gln) amidotransferase subunit GatB [Candidatus Brocadiaceae bacterium]